MSNRSLYYLNLWIGHLKSLRATVLLCRNSYFQIPPWSICTDYWVSHRHLSQYFVLVGTPVHLSRPVRLFWILIGLDLLRFSVISDHKAFIYSKCIDLHSSMMKRIEFFCFLMTYQNSSSNDVGTSMTSSKFNSAVESWLLVSTKRFVSSNVFEIDFVCLQASFVAICASASLDGVRRILSLNNNASISDMLLLKWILWFV